MNEALADQLGAKPIQPALAEIRAVTTRDGFTHLMGKANTTPFASILPVGITIDAKSPQKYAVLAATGGLGLPDRDYYLQASFADKKAKYQAYVAQLLTLAGWDKPAESAKAVVDFESRLAEVQWTRVERRDRDVETYNPMTPAELTAFTPGLDWNRYLADAELSGADRVDRHDEHRLPEVRQDLCRHPARDAESLAGVPSDRRGRGLPLEAFRRRPLRLPQQGTGRPAGAGAPLEARRGLHRPDDRGVGRPGLRGSLLPAGVQGQDAVAGGRHPHRAAPAHRKAGLDGPADPRQGSRQARQVHRQDRLPEQMARLFQAGAEGPTTWSATSSAPAPSNTAATSRG